MDLSDYKAMLAEAEKDVGHLEQQLADLQSVIRFCRRRIQEFEQMTLPLPTPPGCPVNLVGKTVPEAALEIIRAAGRPMRAKEIAKALVSAGFEDKKSLPVTVTTAIRRREDLFRKVDRGLFGLRNGDH